MRKASVWLSGKGGIHMVRFKGVGASDGIVIGPVYPLECAVIIRETRISAHEIEPELARFERALQAADGQLELLQKELDGRQAGQGGRIVEAHRLMLKSGDLVEPVRRLIREECLGAEWAVRSTLDLIRAIFAGVEDRYFRDRVGDVDAIGDRLLRALLELPEAQPGDGAPAGAVAVGLDLSPLDPFQLKRAGVVGLASDGGGRTSHTAILARALGLPFVVGLKTLSGQVKAGDILIIDGGRGEVILDPDQATRHTYDRLAAAERAHLQDLRSLRSLPALTADGTEIHLAANVECLPEIPAALDAGAESIGLFRTEFLYLERSDLPSEEEQYRDAVAAIRALGGRVATFRTLDLGGDKLPAGMDRPKGANPALGMRSIRLSLARPEMFRTQLRALFRAAAVGPIRITFPLISGVTEMAEVQTICDEVCAGLAREGVAHDRKIPLGVMIETPSAAITVDHLAQHCDFFSVGTNDLIQYAFAADRQNEDVGYLYQPLHPAVLRSLKQIVSACRAAKKPLSICGDMAGEPAFVWILLGLGFRDLSMPPRQIATIKSVIRSSFLTEAETLTSQALELRSEIEVEQLVLGAMGERFGPEMEGSPRADLPEALALA
jgi:phosphoenolpyruvate-protein phosphotransferase (PTS system enzyme I)